MVVSSEVYPPVVSQGYGKIVHLVTVDSVDVLPIENSYFHRS